MGKLVNKLATAVKIVERGILRETVLQPGESVDELPGAEAKSIEPAE